MFRWLLIGSLLIIGENQLKFFSYTSAKLYTQVSPVLFYTFF